jgi:diguanylate cyclase (GGDEF)-like protein
VSRYGGEEFVILCSNATMEGLQAFAERIRTAIENEPVRAGGQPLKISVSVGGALLPPSATNTREAELLDAADRAMYRAKQRGRNCCEIVDVQAP